MKPLDLSKPYEEELSVFLSMHPYRDLCIDGAEYHRSPKHYGGNARIFEGPDGCGI